MNHRRGLKALGLSILAALGLMAFAAGGAQASGTFLIEGLKAPWEGATVTGGEDGKEKALDSYLLILKLNVKLSCHEISATGKIKSTGHGHAALEFSNCLVVDSEGNTVACTFKEPITASALALVVLHNSKPYILFSALDGLTFATVETGGEFCTLPPKADVKGNVVAWISNPDGDDIVKLISTKVIDPKTTKPTMLELFTSDILKYGSHEAHLIADALVELSGIHKGLAWGAA